MPTDILSNSVKCSNFFTYLSICTSLPSIAILRGLKLYLIVILICIFLIVMLRASHIPLGYCMSSLEKKTKTVLPNNICEHIQHQILTSKCHSSIKEPRFLGEMSESRIRAGRYYMSMVVHVTEESKEILRK